MACTGYAPRLRLSSPRAVEEAAKGGDKKIMPQRTLKTMLAGGVCAFALAAGGMAAAQTRDFDVPAGDLSVALDAYARQSGVQIIYRIADVSGVRTQGAKGALSSDEALAQLLEGTRFKIRRDPSGAIAIADASDPQSGSAAGGGADAGTVQALIVTAQKREENIQDVPIAMSAFTQEDLTRSQVAGGPDLMTQVPNFTFTKTNFSGYSIQIRGIGTQAISATTDPAVAVAFNNTPFIRNRFFEQEFYDLQRVEVLRGPQGTLYGRNATAGVVNIISAKANPNRFEAKVSADIANYKSKRLEGMINMPLVEGKAALRIAGAWTKRDGYVTNILTGDQIDGRDLWSARVSLNLTPADWFTGNLIYEHFGENDDRLRSGKQLCHKDVGPPDINGVHINEYGDPVFAGAAIRIFYTQGCLPASLYSPDSFQTANGFALPYGPAAQIIGAPVAQNLDPYLNATQSRDLREIETRLKPEYSASTDTVELQFQFDLPYSLTLASETGFTRDQLFSFEDYNRFSTRPGTLTVPGGVYCDPQLGCTDRLAAGDLSTARSQQFSQEFRLSSNFEGPFNFNMGANFLRYDTEDKYYVFINTLNALLEPSSFTPENPGNFENRFAGQYFDLLGYAWGPDNLTQVPVGLGLPTWFDNHDIHHLTDLGRNYFLSKNPYGLISYAAFGEAYYQIADNLKLSAGLRWTIDKKEAPQVPSWLLAGGSYGTPTRKTIRQQWREPTGRVAVDWKPDLGFTDETLLYASYVHGYKAGGSNPPPAIYIDAPVCPPACGGGFTAEIIHKSLTHPQTFEPEFVNAYEIGTKNTLFEGRVTFNLNGFYYDYTGYQISQIVDRSAVNLNFDATIWGSELEVEWRPRENLRFGFKGGYENTRLADGSKAIDLMDRTAGMPGWVLQKPFPTLTSNCIVPVWLVSYGGRLHNVCQAYSTNTDPATNLPYVPFPQEGTFGADPLTQWGPDYPGFDPASAPNNGEGFDKDLSGNALPNAPHFTATITADYTLPLPANWLVTLHTDLYYQSEAWTRVFNTPGYDKLKAYNNINLAAIFSNENAGWQVMAYIKNVLDKDNITGSFLNSDDTGLTTNVFLNEPRLYGLRVTKNWTGSEWWSAHANKSGFYPYQLELLGDYGRVSGGKEILIPDTVALFPANHPYPLGVQNDLDWASAGGVKFTYQPQPKGWFANVGVRYGRASGGAEEHPKWNIPASHRFSQEKYQTLLNTFAGNQQFTDFIKNIYVFDPASLGWYNYATAMGESKETHAIADFAIGKDVGLGRASSRVSLGLRYAQFNSDSSTLLHGRPDFAFPDPVKYEGGHTHRFHASMDAHREFQGAGPAVSWESAIPLPMVMDAGAGRIDVDVGVGAAVLFGRQSTKASGDVHGEYNVGVLRQIPEPGYNYGRHEVNPYNTPFDYHRTTSVTVPGLNANLGLTYTLDGLKLSGGYRIERYLNAIDGGIAQRKTYDRQYDGPYVKVSIGFGG